MRDYIYYIIEYGSKGITNISDQDLLDFITMADLSNADQSLKDTLQAEKTRRGL